MGYLRATMLPRIEAINAMPTPTFQNLAGGSALTIVGTGMYYTWGAGGGSNYGWDLGASYTEALILISSHIHLTNRMLFLSPTLPAAVTVPDKSVCACEEANVIGYQIFRYDAGGVAFVDITGAAGTGGSFQFERPDTAVEAHHTQVALYFNCSSQRRAMLLRKGLEAWYPIIDTSAADANLPATVRYMGILDTTGGVVTPAVDSMWTVCPVAGYAV